MNPVPHPRLVALLAAAALAAAACTGGSSAAPIVPSGAPTETPAAPTTAPAEPTEAPAAGLPADCPTEAPAPLAADETATVTLATEQGDIVIEVKGALGPAAAGNFVALAECGAYDGVIFHRIIPDFMVQSGDVEFGRMPNVDEAMVGKGGPGYSFADDPVTTPYLRGTVAMANAGPDTNGSQFFICVADVSLPPDYTIFGSVLSGMEVADAISTGPSTGGQESRALEPVAITKATVARP